MADLEFSPPKYAQIVTTVQRRIQDGTYPLGGLLPSETQLVREFGASRPTVVRALQVLQSQDGSTASTGGALTCATARSWPTSRALGTPSSMRATQQRQGRSCTWGGI